MLNKYCKVTLDILTMIMLELTFCRFYWFQVIDEFGSFDKYIWSFANYKPIISRFRYPRQVPVKTPKADAISKDLVKRGFRSVGPTVVYSFMQVAGISNDHLISCFRFHECVTAAEGKEVNEVISDNADEKKTGEAMEPEIRRAIDELSLALEWPSLPILTVIWFHLTLTGMMVTVCIFFMNFYPLLGCRLARMNLSLLVAVTVAGKCTTICTVEKG